MEVSLVLSAALLLLVACQRKCSVEGAGGGMVPSPSSAHTDHEELHDQAVAGCAVTESMFAHEFSALAVERMLNAADGSVCAVEKEDSSNHGNHTGDEEDSDLLDPFCNSVYQFAKQILLRLNLTTPCCLGNDTSCEQEPATQSTRTPTAQAYGYGFLMVVLVSLASLLGLLLLPIARSKRFKEYYPYMYALLISLGASALFCDAVLHLIPEALGLHNREAAEGGGHAHSEEGKGEELAVVWRSCVIILGMYAFFLFEFVLHSWASHSHSHSLNMSRSGSMELANLNVTSDPGSPSSPSSPEAEEANHVSTKVAKGDEPNHVVVKVAKGNEAVQGGDMVDATFPHSTCHAHKGDSLGPSILHPLTDECTDKDCQKSKVKVYGRKLGHYLCTIKPLAWLIVVGDSVHNFADGLALGAAISQSLSLGVSTTIALVFHEIPHELGDFFILLSTGMSWYAALFFNFISALTAVLGFFVGVAIGTADPGANNWVLALAAGVFLYIALVDLLPGLIHTKEKFCKRVVLFVMVNIGFLVSFVALLLLAIYEEELNSLITV